MKINKVFTDEHGRILRHSDVIDNPKLHEEYTPEQLKQYIEKGSELLFDAGKVAENESEVNLIGSKTITGKHKPVLDIDFPARLLPSKTPGHFHLMLDGVEINDTLYEELLDTLVQCGIIQKGFRMQYDKQGVTQVRVPKG